MKIYDSSLWKGRGECVYRKVPSCKILIKRFDEPDTVRVP